MKFIYYKVESYEADQISVNIRVSEYSLAFDKYMWRFFFKEITVFLCTHSLQMCAHILKKMKENKASSSAFLPYSVTG